MHIPFVSMVKFKFLAHFPVDHRADPVVSRLILIPREFFTPANADGLSLESD